MEILGIIGTLFIILAFVNTDVNKIRLFDIIGAILFIIYGFTIKSFSTILLNLILSAVNVYQLLRK